MTENDSADYHALSGEAADIGSASLPDFAGAPRLPPSEDDATLDLLPPGDLPTAHALSAAERAALRGVLVDLLHALQLPDRRASLRRLEALLGGLPDTAGRPARIGDTGIPVNAAQVDDFDSYFRVNRITPGQPALGLVRGLLQTARAVMSLFCRAEHLPQNRVQQQIAGFIGYTHLLARTFDLGELS